MGMSQCPTAQTPIISVERPSGDSGSPIVSRLHGDMHKLIPTVRLFQAASKLSRDLAFHLGQLPVPGNALSLQRSVTEKLSPTAIAGSNAWCTALVVTRFGDSQDAAA